MCLGWGGCSCPPINCVGLRPLYESAPVFAGQMGSSSSSTSCEPVNWSPHDQSHARHIYRSISAPRSDRSDYAIRDARHSRVQTIGSNRLEQYEHAQEFNFPFLLTEAELRAICKEALQALSHIQTSAEVDFVGTSRFTDRSTQRFDNFETFLEHAGKRKDPASVEATWSRFEISPEGSAISGRVSLTFFTEQRLVSQSVNPDELPVASIDLSVSGSDQRWVDRTFADLVPHVEVTKLAGILRPLWIFRNAWVVQLLALAMGWIAFLLGSSSAGRLFSAPFQEEKASLLRKMTEAATAEVKLDLYYTWALTPYNSPWYKDVAVFASSMLLFAVVYFVAKVALPKLAPNSAIAIGLASRRAVTTLDTFKFVVFTLLICGLAAPVALELLKWLFA